MSGTRAEVHALTRLALPIIATNLGTMLIGAVDTLMVGRLSKEALAAAALANVWISGTMLFGMGLLFGLDPIVSQAHGSGDGQRAGRALQRGIVVALLISLPLALLWGFTEEFLELVGQDPQLARAAHVYTLVQIPTLPAFLVFVAMRQYLQGRGILAPTLWVIVAANVINALLNWCLIFGKLGAPELGLMGAGIASGLTRLVMFIGLLILFRVFALHRDAWTPWSRRALNWSGLSEVLRFGIPVGIQLGLEIWAFAAATLMAGRLGVLPLAVHSIVLNMAALSFMMPMGVSAGAVTRIGNLIGAGRYHDAQRAAWVSFALGGGAMLGSGILFLTLRNVLPTLYTREAEVVTLCAAILPIAAAFQVFDGLQVVGSGILRGMGKTVPAAWINLVGFWCLALPLAYWMAFERGLGLAGVWWGLALGLFLVAISLLVWIRVRGPEHLAPTG